MVLLSLMSQRFDTFERALTTRANAILFLAARWLLMVSMVLFFAFASLLHP